MPRLSPPQISAELKKITGWGLAEGRLVKEFRFDSFPTAVIFVNNLVDPVEELAVVLMSHVPGELRRRYRIITNMLTYQALED